ncbi:MAG: T9SS type A sorting domain-containing protein [Ignavibacteriaceae bacterium]
MAISNGNLIAGTCIGIYCSTDKGKNWKLTWSDYAMSGSQNRFAVLGKTVLSNNLRSTDGGETWTELGVYASNIAADETNVLATIPFSSGKCSVSLDTGKTWSSTSAGIEHITAVRILKGLENNIFMGSYGSGIFKWSDSTKSWSSITGTLTYPEVLASNDSFLVAGSFGRGIFLSTNNGVDWKTLLGDTNMVGTTALAVNEGNIYAGIKEYGGVYLSSDRGANWTFFGLPGKSVQSLKIQGEYIFAGTWSSGIYRSPKNEVNWTPVWSAGLYVNDFAFKDNHYFAAMDEGVFVSKDFGVNWTRILNSKAKALAFAGERLFAASDNDGIYVSTDLGATWNQTGLTGMGITKLASDGQQIFAGSSSYKGVFWFSDFRQSWRNVGMQGEKIEALVVKGRVLYAAAWIDGVWSTPISEITEVEKSIDSSIPVDFCLFNNYPNPFNPSTTISFTIPSSQMVELKVYDVLGREIAELINEYRQAGSYSAQFNASHLTSGIYFYKLKAGNFIQTKKLILLK